MPSGAGNTKHPKNLSGQEPAAGVFNFPSQMTAETTESVLDALRQLALEPGCAVEFDASGVETLTSAGAQIFLSLEKTLAGLGTALAIAGIPNPIINSLKEMGLEHLAHAHKGRK